MALRRFLLNLAPVLMPFLLSEAAANVRSYRFEPQVITTITLATDEPTTCLLPGAPLALEAANVAAQATDGVGVLISHQPGQNFFSVRALRPDAKAGLNIVLQGRIYALRFVTGANPDRSVTFHEEIPKVPSARLKGLMERAKLNAFQAQNPARAEVVLRTSPRAQTSYPRFDAVIEDVFRYEADHVLVFHVRLQNRTTEAVPWNPDGAGVRIGRQWWSATEVDGSGAIPAGGVAHVYFAICTELPATAPFTVVVPTR